MLARGISGLCVVDKAGDLAGIVTEGDLLRRDEIGTERQRSWWLRLFASPGPQAADFTRANGRHVRDVMTEDVVSVAARCAAGGCCRNDGAQPRQARAGHPGGGVIGVISRSDLLRALIGRVRTVPPLATDDRTIRAAIMSALEARPGRR